MLTISGHKKTRTTIYNTPGAGAERQLRRKETDPNMKKLMKKAAKNFTESCDIIYNKNRGTL